MLSVFQRALLGDADNTNQLETEVKILESPSVLLPVFNFVKDRTTSRNLNFRKWRKKNVSVNLVKGTSVLNIFYRDKQKENILPVIEMMSKEYQKYSGKDRSQGQQQALDYLSTQLKIFRQKSFDSLRETQKFAIENNLRPIKESIRSEQTDDFEINFSVNVQKIRVEAASEIKNYENQIRILSNIGSDPEEILYISNTIPELVGLKIPSQLRAIDNELVKLQAIYNDNDIVIKNLKEKRTLIIETLKRQSMGILKAKLNNAIFIFESSERPKGVVTKYIQLLRESERNATTVKMLENDFHALSLEKAKKEAPWELISKPALNEKPVAPKKIRLIIFNLINGLIIGCLVSLYKEKKSGLVFEKEQFQEFIKNNLSMEIKDLKSENIELISELIYEKFLKNSSELISFIPLGELSSKNMKTFEKKIANNFDNKSFTVSNDIKDIKNCPTKIILSTPGEITRYELMLFMQKLNLINANPIIGWIHFDLKF